TTSNEHFGSEIFSILRAKANSTWRVPPVLNWYDGNCPSLSLQSEVTRSAHTALALHQKIEIHRQTKDLFILFLIRPATPAHLIDCIGAYPRQL
ncbi:uncharacterized protein NPIL_392981, partial [Nephila pilipes]